MNRQFAAVVAGLALAGTLHVGAMADATDPRGAAVTKVNSSGWASRLNRDRSYYGDDQGYYGDPRGYDEGYDSYGYGAPPGYGYGAPPGYAARQPFYGVPGGYEPDESDD